MQDLRLATRAAYLDRREAARRHAITAYYTLTSGWASTGHPPTFERFLRRLGIHPDQDRPDGPRRITDEDRAAAAHAEAVAKNYRGPWTRAG